MNGERLRWLRTKLGRLLRRGKAEAALDAEMQFHLDQLVAQFEAEGMPPSEARLAARREFGDVGSYREEIRDGWRPPELADLWRTLRFAVRSLARSPGFTIFAVVTLAFGIGANTVMFSAFNTIVLKPLPYPDVIVERLQTLPGVASASISSFTPFFNWPDVRRFLVEASQPPERGHEPAAVVNGVSPRYFETVGTRLLAGRAFDERDGAAAPRVFVINQAMANGLFGSESPIGRRLARVDGEGREAGEIVGVAADVISVLPDPRPVTFQLYQPMAQEAVPFDQILVRTAGVAPATVVAGIRGVMTDLDPDLPVRNLKTADASIERANYQPRVLRDILSGFAVLGLFLASLGIYGVIARTMSQRTSEFAIRFALGARIFHVTRIVLASGLKLALIGSAVGLIGALGLFRILAYGFPSIQLGDPLVLIGTTLVLATVALVACWLPARRAARINPVEALRAE